MSDRNANRITELEQLAISAFHSGDRPGAAEAASQAIRLIEAEGGNKDKRLIPLFRLLAKAVHRWGETVGADEAVTWLRQAVDVAEGSDIDDATKGMLWAQTGIALKAAGNLSEARAFLERALQCSTKNNNPEAISFDLSALAQIVMQIAPLEAVPLWQRLVEVESGLDPRSTNLLVAHAQLGRTLLLAGKLNDAISPLEHALGLVQLHTHGTPNRWSDEINELLATAREGSSDKH